MDNNVHFKNTALSKTKARIEIQDSSNIPQMKGSSTIQQIQDSSNIQQMQGSSTIQPMEGSSTIKQMIAFLKIKDDRNLIRGVWLNGAKNAQIEIFQTDSNTYAGRIVWLRVPIDTLTKKPKLDKLNPDTTLRKQPLIGLVSFKNFIYEGKGIWNQGTGYDPTTGRTYNGRITMNIKNADFNKIKLTGYWKTPLLRRSSLWIRMSLPN